MPEKIKRPMTVRVLPWEGFGWGIDVDYGDGTHDAYPVGLRDAAEAEAARIRSGGRVRSPSAVARLLNE